MTTTAKPKPRRATDPAMQELYKLLLKSEKFLNWKPEYARDEEKFRTVDGDDITACLVAEKHYEPNELAELWGVSAETIRNVFRNEPGVLRISSPNGKLSKKRKYVLMRVPESVAERVHKRLSAVPLTP